MPTCINDVETWGPLGEENIGKKAWRLWLRQCRFITKEVKIMTCDLRLWRLSNSLHSRRPLPRDYHVTRTILGPRCDIHQAAKRDPSVGVWVTFNRAPSTVRTNTVQTLGWYKLDSIYSMTSGIYCRVGENGHLLTFHLGPLATLW